jgi:hypothetical protein
MDKEMRRQRHRVTKKKGGKETKYRELETKRERETKIKKERKDRERRKMAKPQQTKNIPG